MDWSNRLECAFSMRIKTNLQFQVSQEKRACIENQLQRIAFKCGAINEETLSSSARMIATIFLSRDYNVCAQVFYQRTFDEPVSEVQRFQQVYNDLHLTSAL